MHKNKVFSNKRHARDSEELPLNGPNFDETRPQTDLSQRGESPQISLTQTGADNKQMDSNPEFGQGNSDTSSDLVDDSILSILQAHGEPDGDYYMLDGMRIGNPKNGTWEWNHQIVGNADLLNVLSPYAREMRAQMVSVPTPDKFMPLSESSKLTVPWNEGDNQGTPFVVRPQEDFKNFKRYVTLWKKYNGKNPNEFKNSKEYLEFIALKNVFGSPNQQSVYHDAYGEPAMRKAEKTIEKLHLEDELIAKRLRETMSE